MKILQITPVFLPDVHGTSKHVYYLSKGLIENGHDVTVFTVLEGTDKQNEVIEGINICRFPVWINIMKYRITPTMILKLLKKNKYDIIHIHSHMAFQSNIAAFAKKINKTRLIITLHGVHIKFHKNWQEKIKKKFDKSIGYYTLKKSDKIIFLREENFRFAQSLIKFDNSKSCIIPPPYEFKSDLVDVHIPFKYPIKLLYLGRLDANKNVKLLLEVVQELKDKVTLDIVGDGPLRNYLEDMVLRCDLQNNVKFHGLQKDPSSFLNNCDLLVISSKYEGFPVTILDAIDNNKLILAPSHLSDVLSVDLTFKDKNELITKILNINITPNVGQVYSKIKKHSNYRCVVNKIYSI